MNSSKKYNVFISHSSKDKKISDLLCNLMIKAGLTVWYDENSMLPNTSLTTDIPKYISNSEVLLVVLSKNSCDSRWVEEEYNYAKELLYKQELKIIPIVVDDCKLPGFYNNYKWIDCREGLDCFSFSRFCLLFMEKQRISGRLRISMSVIHGGRKRGPLWMPCLQD